LPVDAPAGPGTDGPSRTPEAVRNGPLEKPKGRVTPALHEKLIWLC